MTSTQEKPMYVRCPETITSPAPHPALGLPPNMRCGLRVAVIHAGPVMEFRCPRGHSFIATEEDIETEAR